jgi:BirA family biotin operon repressor/biotin-[acetyl-CoA-carboxylase] ligase
MPDFSSNSLKYETRLQELFSGRAIKVFDNIGSTQDVGLAWLRDGGEAGSLVIADRQVSGRGRMGRAWHNPSGVSIAMSVILKPLPDYLSQISMLAALSVVDTLEAFAVKGVTIKWPNDIRISGKKVGGILPEAIWEGERLIGVVLGIGLNVTTDFEDSELETRAVSMAHALGYSVDRIDVCRRLVDQIEFWASRLGSTELLEAWKNRLETLGQYVIIEVTQSKIIGYAEKVDPDGALYVRDEKGDLNKVVAGDIVMNLWQGV